MGALASYIDTSNAIKDYLRGDGREARLLDLLACLYCAGEEVRKEAIAPTVENITESTFSVEPMAWVNPADPETILKAIKREHEQYLKGLEKAWG